MVIDMTKEEILEFHRKNARDKWYKLGLILSESDVTVKVKDLCKKMGMTSNTNLQFFLDRWGDEMMEKYGKLPFRKLNTSRYNKYMEMK